MVSFDGVNKLIIADNGTTSINVKELYSTWKEWVQIADNLKYEIAFTVVGGEPTTGNNIITPYFFLSNGWKIRPQEASHTLAIDGILITDDGSDAFTDTLGVFRVGINQIVPIYTESVLMETGTSGLTSEESSKLDSLDTSNLDGSISSVLSVINALKTLEDDERTKLMGLSDGLDASSMHTALDSYTNKDDWKGDSTDIQPILDAVSSLNDITVSDIEQSSILAKEGSITNMRSVLDATKLLVEGIDTGMTALDTNDMNSIYAKLLEVNADMEELLNATNNVPQNTYDLTFGKVI